MDPATKALSTVFPRNAGMIVLTTFGLLVYVIVGSGIGTIINTIMQRNSPS